MTSDAIVKAVQGFCEQLGMVPRQMTWCLEHDEVHVAVNIQKSIYSDRYYINIGFWLKALGSKRFPKDADCHVRIRLDNIVEGSAALSTLLDLETSMSDRERQRQLTVILDRDLRPFLAKMSSLAGIRQAKADGDLRNAAIRRSAQEAPLPPGRRRDDRDDAPTTCS